MAQTLDPELCCVMHWDRWHHVQCSRKGHYEHDGKKYCKQHHPDTKKARLEAQEAEYQQRRERWNRLDAKREAEALVLRLAKEWYQSPKPAWFLEVEGSEPMIKLSQAVEALIKLEEQ